jgi:uncharacterized protein (DUF488 family)
MSVKLRAYSLGYQGLQPDQYVEVLKANNITLVIDVRETPWSYKPGFSKKPLAVRLQAEGIEYIHLKSAGNPSRNRKMGLPPASVIDLYKAHLDEDPSCLETIRQLIVQYEGAVCLLCFEESPGECHRKVILDRLSEKDHRVVACHLHGTSQRLKQQVGTARVPKADDREGARKHVEVSEYESGLVAI